MSDYAKMRNYAAETVVSEIYSDACGVTVQNITGPIDRPEIAATIVGDKVEWVETGRIESIRVNGKTLRCGKCNSYFAVLAKLPRGRYRSPLPPTEDYGHTLASCLQGLELEVQHPLLSVIYPAPGFEFHTEAVPEADFFGKPITLIRGLAIENVWVGHFKEAKMGFWRRGRWLEGPYTTPPSIPEKDADLPPAGQAFSRKAHLYLLKKRLRFEEVKDAAFKALEAGVPEAVTWTDPTFLYRLQFGNDPARYLQGPIPLILRKFDFLFFKCKQCKAGCRIAFQIVK